MPHGDKAASAAAVAREFGATAALFGTVYRYRERRGGELGATRPASVGIELDAARCAGRAARSDRALRPHPVALSGERARGASRYPGAGSRWLTAAELRALGARRARRSA